MTSAPTALRQPRRRRIDVAGIGFTSPVLLLSAGFVALPLLLAFVYSFARIAPLSGSITWVGMRNYVTMFTDPTFYRALVNTAIFTVLTVPVSMAIGLGLAVLLNSVMPARRVFRTIIYLPLVISGVAVGLVGTFLFNETTGIGLSFLQGQYQTDYGALMAMTLLSVGPLVVLFLAFQRHFVAGMATTGLK